MKYDTDLMGQLIRFVSSHEVGHTLGLRHNFGSSSTVPVDSLRSRAFVEKYGHTPSIMDYARFNYVAQPEDSIPREGIFPRIGDYDCWAIEWGYKPMWNAYDEVSDHWELEKLTTERLKVTVAYGLAMAKQIVPTMLVAKRKTWATMLLRQANMVFLTSSVNCLCCQSGPTRVAIFMAKTFRA